MLCCSSVTCNFFYVNMSLNINYNIVFIYAHISEFQLRFPSLTNYRNVYIDFSKLKT